jgi:hypothetical protein
MGNGQKFNYFLPIDIGDTGYEGAAIRSQNPAYDRIMSDSQALIERGEPVCFDIGFPSKPFINDEIAVYASRPKALVLKSGFPTYFDGRAQSRSKTVIRDIVGSDPEFVLPGSVYTAVGQAMLTYLSLADRSIVGWNYIRLGYEVHKNSQLLYHLLTIFDEPLYFFLETGTEYVERYPTLPRAARSQSRGPQKSGGRVRKDKSVSKRSRQTRGTEVKPATNATRKAASLSKPITPGSSGPVEKQRLDLEQVQKTEKDVNKAMPRELVMTTIIRDAEDLSDDQLMRQQEEHAAMTSVTEVETLSSRTPQDKCGFIIFCDPKGFPDGADVIDYSGVEIASHRSNLYVDRSCLESFDGVGSLDLFTEGMNRCIIQVDDETILNTERCDRMVSVAIVATQLGSGHITFGSISE